ncbi:MAG: long-chain-fatty-acid--CoA ligase [Nitrospiraceae bacterium]
MDRVWLKQYDPGVPGTLSYPDIALPDLLTRAAERYPDRPALRFYGRVIRYRELDALATRFAHALMNQEIRKGGVVGLMLPNLPQTVIGYYGSLRAGAIVTPVNPLFVESEIAHQVSDSGCETILALDQFYPRLKPLLGRTCLKRVILTGVADYLPWLKRLLYPLKMRGQGRYGPTSVSPAVSTLRQFLSGPPGFPPVRISRDDVALLQYTGGTTGIPKGVVLTHRNLVCNTWQCRSWMTALREGEEVFLGVLPFFHVYGMSACLNLAVGVAGSLALLPRFHVTEVLEAITRERVTVFPGVPAMFSAINTHQNLERYDLRSLRLCISGAGPLHSSVQDRFEALTGARLVEGYGLTEAGPVTHVNLTRPESGERRRRSIGLPLPDTDAKIMDIETGERELRIGEIGELAVRGPQVMPGYWKREDETRHVLRNDWLFTGDLARMDASGFFYIEDRKKDMIKSGGENVYPREVEEVLVRHPKIKEAVVAGIPQGLRGELIKAYVVLKDGENATTADILDHCRHDLAKFKVPKKVEFRPELPKTLVGKVLRRVLVEEELKKEGAGQEQ